jgi:hypothetical protein
MPTICIIDIKRWCLQNLYLYYPIERIKSSLTFYKVFLTKLSINFHQLHHLSWIKVKFKFQQKVYYYVHICTHNWELVKLSGKSWQLVTFIHKEGDGQMFCE